MGAFAASKKIGGKRSLAGSDSTSNFDKISPSITDLVAAAFSNFAEALSYLMDLLYLVGGGGSGQGTAVYRPSFYIFFDNKRTLSGYLVWESRYREYGRMVDFVHHFESQTGQLTFID